MTSAIRIDGDVAYVELTQGYEATIDAADVPLVAGWKWRALVKRHTVGTIRSIYAMRHTPQVGGVRSAVQMHRVIMSPRAGEIIDHIDGDGLNNRRGNLRIATNAQNQMNRRLGPKNKSGAKGVVWNARRKKWQAQIMIGGVMKYLGLFSNTNDAAAAYASASAEIHGPFGRTS